MVCTTYPHGPNYFSKKRNVIDLQNHFLSFEDALWSLISRNVSINSTLLFPSFFCVDVLDNCRLHGYKVETYPLDKYLEISEELLSDYIERTQPRVIFVFHPLGYYSKIIDYKTIWRDDMLVIEDSVHRLVDSPVLRNDNHIIIDSIRKITPLFGSCIWTTLALDKPKYNFGDIIIFVRIYYFWRKFQSVINSGTGQGSIAKVVRGYNYLNSSDNQIGDNYRPIALPTYLAKERQYLDILKIQSVRSEQWILYNKSLFNFLHDERFCIMLNSHPLDQPAFYPLITISDYAFLIREYLLSQRVVTFVEFSDSSWSVDKNILCLPLGTHVSVEDVENICSAINMWYQDRFML
jgi:hypothetical protein